MCRARARPWYRVRLARQLQQGVKRALTLVSAPADFSKTTLLAQWLMKSEIPIAWLSLEAQDNDPSRFLSYLIASLQILDAQLGTTALAMLRTPRPQSSGVVLAVLTNDLVERGGGDIGLVLSVNTFKRPIYNLSGKLGVRSRAGHRPRLGAPPPVAPCPSPASPRKNHHTVTTLVCSVVPTSPAILYTGTILNR